MRDQIFKKNLVSRLSAYLLLIPFIPTIRPIVLRHNTSELVVYIFGFLLTILLVIYSNIKPYIKVTDKNVFIYLMYKHKPEIHYISSIERMTIRSNKKSTLYTKGFDPLEIRLSKNEQKRFINILETKDVTISKAYRN